MTGTGGNDGPLHVEILDSHQRDLAALAWAEIEQDSATLPVVCRWAWTDVWLDHYGDSRTHRFAIVRRGSRACAAVLLVYGRARRSRITLRTLHLGTAGGPPAEEVAVERNGLLCREENRAEVAAALMERLRGERGFSELRLDGFLPAHFQALAAVEPSLAGEPSASPAIDLVPARESGDVRTLLAAKTRYHVRRSLKTYGEVTGEWASTESQALDIFDELVELHQHRWESVGEPGAFASQRRLGFARSLIPRLLSDERIVLFRARSDQQTVGCLYNLIDGNDMLVWQLGLAARTDNRVTPGVVTHVLAMQQCLERGLDTYDLLAGDAAYKSELSTVQLELIWGRGLRRGARSALAEGLRAARDRLPGAEA